MILKERQTKIEIVGSQSLHEGKLDTAEEVDGTRISPTSYPRSQE